MKHQSSIKATILFNKVYLSIFQQKYQLSIFFNEKWQADCNCVIWCMSYALNYKFQFDPFCLGESLCMDETSLMLDECLRLTTQIWQLSKIDRLRSVIVLVWLIRSKMEQESSDRDGCLAFLQYICFYQGTGGCTTWQTGLLL